MRKIFEVFREIKNTFYVILSGTKAECTIPFDALELVARSLWSDIVKYYEEKRSQENSEVKQEVTPLTEK